MAVDQRDRGSAEHGQLERVLDYLAFMAMSHALSELLDEAPKRIARCVGADVASIYLLEGDGRSMVMRGNVGFPEHAKGRVRLGIGEGITGRAVEVKHAIFAADAAEHGSYRAFPELEEERFPALAAVPILGAGGPLGAVVVQRTRDRPFAEAEVCLVAALAAAISSAIRFARLLDDLRDPPANPAGSGTKRVTLTGEPVVSGRALGPVAAVRRPSSAGKGNAEDDDTERLEAVIETTTRALEELMGQALERGLGARAEFLDGYVLMLRDQRLRQRAIERLGDGDSLHVALGHVTREATRAASESRNEFLVERARDLEQLCDVLVMMASPDSRATLPNKAVLVVDRLSIYDLLVSARARPVAVVLTQEAPGESTRVLMELLGMPAISGVAGALKWMSPGDVALVDADHGLLVVNPSRADIAAFRAERRREHT